MRESGNEVHTHTHAYAHIPVHAREVVVVGHVAVLRVSAGSEASDRSLFVTSAVSRADSVDVRVRMWVRRVYIEHSALYIFIHSQTKTGPNTTRMHTRAHRPHHTQHTYKQKYSEKITHLLAGDSVFLALFLWRVRMRVYVCACGNGSKHTK